MNGNSTLSARIGAAFTAVALAAALGTHPAVAQTTTDDPAAEQELDDMADEDALDDAGGPSAAASTAAAADGACVPGALGEGGTYDVRGETGERLVRAEIGHQCERTLEDGTYVPGGYRVQLYEACNAGECELPFVFASELRNGTFGGVLEDDGERMQLRLRANPNGVIVLNMVSGGRGEARQRERYTLRTSR